jgi:hypothetical protein
VNCIYINKYSINSQEVFLKLSGFIWQYVETKEASLNNMHQYAYYSSVRRVIGEFSEYKMNKPPCGFAGRHTTPARLRQEERALLG